MKNLFIVLLAILSLGASAQGFQGGISGGLNAARIDGDGHEIYGKLGLNLGAFASREIIRDQLYWQMEIKYTSRGKYQGPTRNFFGIEIIDLRYVELPLSIQYLYNDKLQFEIGISPDVLLAEYYADENGAISPEFANDLDRFGVTAFAGINYFVLSKLAVGMRFNYSIIPFYKFDAYAIRYRDSGYFHDVLSLNARYYFSRN
jgi:hypothetical protein